MCYQYLDREQTPLILSKGVLAAPPNTCIANCGQTTALALTLYSVSIAYFFFLYRTEVFVSKYVGCRMRPNRCDSDMISGCY